MELKNTVIHILNSTITDSHYVAIGHSILVQYGSHIYFMDTNISGNKPAMPQPFIKVAHGSSAKMVNCIYKNNVRQLHFYVIYDSSLIITDSQIINNTDTYHIVAWVSHSSVFKQYVCKKHLFSKQPTLPVSSSISYSKAIFLHSVDTDR